MNEWVEKGQHVFSATAGWGWQEWLIVGIAHLAIALPKIAWREYICYGILMGLCGVLVALYWLAYPAIAAWGAMFPPPPPPVPPQPFGELAQSVIATLDAGGTRRVGHGDSIDCGRVIATASTGPKGTDRSAIVIVGSQNVTRLLKKHELEAIHEVILEALDIDDDRTAKDMATRALDILTAPEARAEGRAA
jgi:hypothetical protein